MKPFAQRLIQVFGSALILAFFSEFLFLNEGPMLGIVTEYRTNPVVFTLGQFELICYYGLFAYVMLIAIDVFRVGTWSGLILAGGLYGLSAEALVTPAVYEAIPYSLFWTSLSWHTLVDVVLGWYILRRAMRVQSILPATILFLAIGVFWGIWATWFWAENISLALELVDFSALTLISSSYLLMGLMLADRVPISRFRASRLERLLVILISAGLFGLTGFPYLPWPALVLLIVVAILMGLRAGKGQGQADYLAPLNTATAWSRYLLVPLMPAAAIATYTIVLKTGFQVEVEAIVLPLLGAGFLSFFAALALPFIRKRRTQIKK